MATWHQASWLQSFGNMAFESLVFLRHEISRTRGCGVFLNGENETIYQSLKQDEKEKQCGVHIVGEERTSEQVDYK